MIDSFFRHYNINYEKDTENMVNLGVAISSPIRVAMLKQLMINSMTLTELSKKNYISMSAVQFHVSILEKANLVKIEYMAGKKRDTKIVRAYLQQIELFFGEMRPEPTADIDIKTFNIPIGSYTRFDFNNRCGIVDTKEMFEGPFDPRRINAQLLWVDSGYVSYKIDNFLTRSKEIVQIDIGLEICSEAPNYNLDWKSDITFFINDIELCTYTSPSDFGGRRGKFTPDFWPDNSTQFGEWKKITVNRFGVYLDGVKVVSKTVIDDLKLGSSYNITFTIGNKPNSKYNGGFNIFGKNFGDFNKDIEVTLTYLK